MKNLQKKLNVWILQTGEPLIIDGKNLRFMRGMNLANKLIEKGHRVFLFSSNFFHQKKTHRYTIKNGFKKIKYNSKLIFYLIDSPGYKKNISIKRFYDHLIMGANLKKILSGTVEKPDVAFIGYPPIEVAHVMSEWLFNRKISYILDVKDQWPNVILEVFPKKFYFIFKFFLFPYYYLFKKIASRADSITSMSKSFINWTLKYSNKDKKKINLILPLVSDKKKKISKNSFNDWCKKNKLNIKNSFNILFVGSMSRSFDFETIIKCAKQMNGYKINFILCGDGEQKKFYLEASKKVENIHFTGWADADVVNTIKDKIHVAIAPYINFQNFTQNVPNKIIDYLSFGLPILSPLKGEVASLINKNRVGLSYKEKSSNSLKNRILEFYNNKKKLELYANNAKKLYVKNYNYDSVYDNAIKLIKTLKEKNDIRHK